MTVLDQLALNDLSTNVTLYLNTNGLLTLARNASAAPSCGHKVQVVQLHPQLRSGVPTCDILCVYCSVIRSVLEYACAVWHPGLTKNYLKILSVLKSVV